MVLKSEELLGTLTATARANSLRNLKQSNSPSGSMEPVGKNAGYSSVSMEANDGQPKKSSSTSEKIADIARTSRVQVDRLRRVKREAPEKYAEVIDGKKSIRKAYDELPPIRKRKSKRSAVQEEQEATVVSLVLKYLTVSTKEIRERKALSLHC